MEAAVPGACNPVRYISVGYSRSCFQLRNKCTVGHAAKVIAVFDGKKSGTQNTIDYARRVGVSVIRIEG